MHVPSENLARYRRIIELYRKVDNIGNRRSNRGDYAGANAAWRRAGKIQQAAQQLRVMGWREAPPLTDQQMQDLQNLPD